MIKIKDLEGFTDTEIYQVTGTSQWYYSKQHKGESCDLAQVVGIIEEDGKYPGSICHLIHYPDGKVYTPFAMKENVYMEEPRYDDGKFAFLLVDFGERKSSFVCGV